MKKFTMILALVAVLAMAGTTFADITISATQTGSVGTLEVWTVYTNGASTYTDMQVGMGGDNYVFALDGVTEIASVDAEVHQVSLYSSALSSAFLNSTAAPPAGDASDADTHFMLSIGNETGNAAYFGTEAETNDGSGGVQGTANYGWGSLSTPGDFGVLGGGGAQTLMQVILAPGTVTHMFGIVGSSTESIDLAVYGDGGATAGYSARETGFRIGAPVPEPSTILMLLVGGLCLLAVRFRK